MALDVADRLAIMETVALHGHLVDAGELDRMHEAFTADVAYDVTDLGFGVLEGLSAVEAAGWQLGARNPVGHHVTNTVVGEPDGEGRVPVRSKGIGIQADGSCGSMTYEDTVVHTEAGWRISRRRIRAHRVPLGGRVS
jgi:SnoaL-like protein